MRKILSDPRSPIYSRVTSRDWHLHYRNLIRLIDRPAILDRVRALLRPDLVLWRTTLFHKAPGGGGLGWHQASVFAGEEYGNCKPALEPPADAETFADVFNISVWIALDDVRQDNGAVCIAPGTHAYQYPVRRVPFLESEFARVFIDNLRRAGDQQRLAELSTRYANETVFDPDTESIEPVSIEMKRGDYFIFTDRVMHASYANDTGKRRLGINFRITRPDVAVYPHRWLEDYIDGNDHDIRRHACLMLCGRDRHGRNLYIN